MVGTLVLLASSATGAAVVLPATATSRPTEASLPGKTLPAGRGDRLTPADRRAISKPSQELAILLEAQEVMSRPSEHSAPVSFVPASRPITGERTVLPVIGRSVGAGGVRWLKVMVPGRPNGRTGWIRQLGTTRSTTVWRIVVETSERRVIVYDGGSPVREFDAIVGAPSTPTPLGEFFVEEDVQMPAKSVGAPYALALSARSNVLQEFDGGPGQIAIHGLGNIGGVLGTAVSHGCVRLDSTAMTWLVLRVVPGVPVTITR